jgi:beta-glucosidase-like glycosyl hydrolase
MTQHAPLIIDIAGLDLTAKDRQRLKHPLVGGIILFARNWRNREQLSSCAVTSKMCATICSFASITKVAACSVSRPMGSPTCRRCVPWARCG